MSRLRSSALINSDAREQDCKGRAVLGPSRVITIQVEFNGATRAGTSPAPTALSTTLAVFLLLIALAFVGCAVDERRNVPAEAQATVERVTEDIAAGRDAKVYEEAADEWRAAVSADENVKILSRVRERLGRVENRVLHKGREQAAASAPLSGHTLELVYNTRFERGEAMERFTLLERGGDWLLAGYSVTSDTLR
jgi:hypothetical protein